MAPKTGPGAAAPVAPKATGKAKAKGKKPLSAKAKAKLREAKKAEKLVAKAAATAAATGAGGEQAEGEAAPDLGPGGGAIVVAKPKKMGGSGARKKLIESLGDKSLEEALEELKALARGKDAVNQEHNALKAAHDKQEAEAAKEFEELRQACEAAVAAEAEVAKQLCTLKEKRDEAQKLIGTKRVELLEAQKKLAMLEVIAINHNRMKDLEAKRRAAAAAAEEAKKTLLEQRQKEKDALEATRQALAEAKARASGKKRATEEHPVEGTATSAEPGSAKKARPGASPSKETAAAAAAALDVE